METTAIVLYVMMAQVVGVMKVAGKEGKNAKNVVFMVQTLAIGKIKIVVSQEPAL
jgi:hypothetical protein